MDSSIALDLIIVLVYTVVVTAGAVITEYSENKYIAYDYILVMFMNLFTYIILSNGSIFYMLLYIFTVFSITIMYVLI